MIYKIPYTTYSFNDRLIEPEIYQNLKESYDKNGFLEFPEPKTYFEEHNGESLLTIISFSVFILSLPFLDSIEGTIFFLVFMISFILFIFSIIFQFSQFFTFQKSRKKQIQYLKKLKNDIIRARDYHDFVQLQKIK